MFTIGLTSISFRELSMEDVASIASKQGLETIEWGGDIHCPPGDEAAARKANALCKQYGLSVNSYGSYYTLTGLQAPVDAFQKVLDSAKAMEAPIIRIWAGDIPSKQISPEMRTAMTNEARVLAAMTAKAGMKLGFEYHDRSLTDNCESAVRLIDEIGNPDCRLYYQMDPLLDFSGNLNALKYILKYVICVHMFAFDDNHIQQELSFKQEEWRTLSGVLSVRDLPLLLEHVKDHSIDVFCRDCVTLKEITKKA